MQINIMRFLLFLLTQYLKLTMARVRIRDTRMIGRTTTICKQYLIATVIAQHAYAMRRLLLAEKMTRFYVWSIKQIHAFNQ